MARRVSFLEDAVSTLELASVQVRRGRAEELEPSSVDVVVARAVAPLVRLVPMTLPLLRPGGRLVALKGSNAEGELDAAKSVLQHERGATVSLVQTPAGGDVATVVLIVLDAGR
jgi:16S rRNA (guanine527-N7)-methyltransferase